MQTLQSPKKFFYFTYFFCVIIGKKSKKKKNILWRLLYFTFFFIRSNLFKVFVFVLPDGVSWFESCRVYGICGWRHKIVLSIITIRKFVYFIYLFFFCCVLLHIELWWAMFYRLARVCVAGWVVCIKSTSGKTNTIFCGEQ